MIDIDFNNKTNYLTHNYHPYPAKFVPQIPKHIILKYTHEGDWVLDPFCGSGTTLVEASLLGRNAIGIDINPIATLAARVKTTSLTDSDIETVKSFLVEIDINSNLNNLSPNIKYDSFIKEVLPKTKLPVFNNRDHWFNALALKELRVIKYLINERSGNESVYNFLNLALSRIIVPISNQDSEVRYTAVKKNLKKGDAFRQLYERINDMLKRNIQYKKRRKESTVNVYTEDSRNLSRIPDNQIDCVVTSPPYVNTFDYYLYHKQRMHWLDFDPSIVRKFEIGCHHTTKNFEQAVNKYETDLTLVFNEFQRVMKKKSYVCFVIGDGIVEGKMIQSDLLIRKIAKMHNFKYQNSLTQNLKETTRNFNVKFSRKQKNEHIILFQKSE